MRLAKKWWVILAIVAMAFVFVASAKFRNSNVPGEHDEFAKCLTEKGVVMYGAYWCPHCKNQEELFGSSWKHVNYVECSLPNRAGQTAECSKAGIMGYPTWEFSDGQRVEGELPFSELSRLSGCKLNGE